MTDENTVRPPLRVVDSGRPKEPNKLPPAAARLYAALIATLRDDRETLIALGLSRAEAEVIAERVEAFAQALERHFPEE